MTRNDERDGCRPDGDSHSLDLLRDQLTGKSERRCDPFFHIGSIRDVAKVVAGELRPDRDRSVSTDTDPSAWIINLALDLAKNCAASYGKAKPEVRKMWNQAFFRTIRVQDGRIADSTV